MPDQVEFLLQHGTRGLLDGHAQLGGDDPRQRRLAQARRPVQQHVVHRLSAAARGFNGDREIFFDLGLAGEVG